MYVIIPARYASTRLPGKPLVTIKGKTLIERVFDCARNSRAERIIIATDDPRIEKAAAGFGAEVCMTSPDHTSGTERIAEVIDALRIDKDKTIVNLQGDEPLMPGTLINQVADTLEQSSLQMATACHPISSEAEINNPNVVKVVIDRQGRAIYFSRAAIPFIRDRQPDDGTVTGVYNRHIGIYAYRAGFLKQYVQWPRCDLERIESLEQLRVIWNGEQIAVCQSSVLPGPGVDTPADVTLVEALI